MQKTYSTFLFDWDGCIANSLPVWIEGIILALKKRNIEITEEKVIKDILYQHNYYEKYNILDKDIFNEEIDASFISLMPKVTFYDQVLEFILELNSKNKKIGLVTSSSRFIIEQLFILHSLDKHFHTTFCWEDTENNKPHPEPILKAMDKLQAKPKETMMIGDSQSDILGAKEAGVTSVWFNPEHNRKFFPENFKDLYKPDIIITHFDELKKFI